MDAIVEQDPGSSGRRDRINFCYEDNGLIQGTPPDVIADRDEFEQALARAREETLAFEQEMFEINRHAAHAMMERQNLVWRLAELQADRDQLVRDCDNLKIARDKLKEDRDNLLAARDEAIRQREHARQACAETCQIYERRLQAMYDSTSWKFARPVRAASRLVRLLRGG